MAASGSLSSAEAAYIAAGVAQGLRSDGRGCLDVRPIEIQPGVLLRASGSARLRLGATDVLVGVKVQNDPVDPDRPGEGRLAVSVECTACASPEYEGRGGQAWEQLLSRSLEDVLRGGPGKDCGLDLSSLVILAGKEAWTVFVDAVVLNDGGNVLDALSYAAVAALGDTRVPGVRVLMGEEGEEAEVEFDDDDSQPLATGALPVFVTVSQVGNRCIVDCCREEEACASGALQVGVGPSGQICRCSKAGGRGLHPAVAAEMLEVAQRTGTVICSQLAMFMAGHRRD